ncbi:gamma-aminobutyrate:proton symporter (AAT family) [Novosphingobium kunmingense]|uniref:Gamma-aminobutyrate:proton symporter (AAT family) n=1 Tax=Novosphingobium kunmingense TaxID=1211806 RepID=A0A2N0I1Z9_9SPHN|nr:amino acid permease [Novosphingobium kunmingense]PKB25214.1 gamma-aminobutyrate:proton symporter (AAT family) [Novosphingobium kunmingense]
MPNAVPAEDVAAGAYGAPGLSQSLQNRHISMIAIGGIIGAGLFVGSSTTISQVGPAAVVTYALAGLIIMLVMRMISEMAMAMRGVQAFPDFARAGIGHWAGFLSGWLYWYFWVVVVAIEAIAGAKILADWFPQFPTWQIGVMLMALLTGVNLLSTRSYGEFEFWFSLMKVVAIVAFIFVAGAWAFGISSPSGSTFANLSAHGGFAPNGWGVVLAAVTSTIFALCGAEISTIAAAESAEPAKAVARLSLTVTVRIVVFYILAILMIVAVVPWTQIVPGYSPFASTLAAMNMSGGETIMNLVVLVAVLSCLNSGLYVTSRTLFGLASHGDAPQWLVAVNKRKVPARSILVASLFSYGALAMERISPDTVFSFLLNSSGVTMLLLYLMVAVAQLRTRTRVEQQDPASLELKMWFHPFATLFAIAAMLAVVLFMAIDPALASQFWASLAVAALFLLGFAAMSLSRR